MFLKSLKTKMVVKNTNTAVRFPLAFMLFVFIVTDKITITSPEWNAVKWTIFGAIITLALTIYVARTITQKEVDIFSPKLMTKPEEQPESSIEMATNRLSFLDN